MNLKKPVIVIEHLEPRFSRWLEAEYLHSLQIAGTRLVFTNMGKLCSVIQWPFKPYCYMESVRHLAGILYNDPRNIIVLDPTAKDTLTPEEAARAEVIVIGGILGDHPPRRRTSTLLTRHLVPPGISRNIGKHQLSIDGAVYVALKIIEGRSLNDIEFIISPKIVVEDGFFGEVEIILPYAYPIVDGRPLISRKVIEILRKGSAYDFLEMYTE